MEMRVYNIARILYVMSCLSVWNMFFLGFKSKNKGLIAIATIHTISFIIIGVSVFDRTFNSTDVCIISMIALLGLFMNSCMLIANLYSNRAKPMIANILMVLSISIILVVFIVNAFLLGLS